MGMDSDSVVNNVLREENALRLLGEKKTEDEEDETVEAEAGAATPAPAPEPDPGPDPAVPRCAADRSALGPKRSG